MKSFILSALALAALTPVAVRADEPTTHRFEHDGHRYSYAVTKTGDTRVITGIEEKSGKAFKLRVGKHRVRGTVGSQQISFSLRDVRPLDTRPTAVASR